mmetsp:Transcript_25033/g.66358  ORF Transcript_25033/g.66358 Transcript_25033/m.66358 type:complete len:200 (-) Transcript_25033:678-1277(-)
MTDTPALWCKMRGQSPSPSPITQWRLLVGLFEASASIADPWAKMASRNADKNAPSSGSMRCNKRRAIEKAHTTLASRSPSRSEFDNLVDNFSKAEGSINCTRARLKKAPWCTPHEANAQQENANSCGLSTQVARPPDEEDTAAAARAFKFSSRATSPPKVDRDQRAFARSCPLARPAFCTTTRVSSSRNLVQGAPRTLA